MGPSSGKSPCRLQPLGVSPPVARCLGRASAYTLSASKAAASTQPRTSALNPVRRTRLLGFGTRSAGSIITQPKWQQIAQGINSTKPGLARAYHRLSQSEIAGDKRISQHLSGPEPVASITITLGITVSSDTSSKSTMMITSANMKALSPKPAT